VDPTLERLLQEAGEAARKAYAPYSNFQVGAALLTTEGETVTGANVENASYALSICAERVAASCAISRGYRDFKALAVSASSDSPPTPCGACLQFLSEFSGDLVIVTAGRSGEGRVTSLSRLLPQPFRL